MTTDYIHFCILLYGVLSMYLLLRYIPCTMQTGVHTCDIYDNIAYRIRNTTQYVRTSYPLERLTIRKHN